MFAWYKASAVCFAYLADVESTSTTRLPKSQWGAQLGTDPEGAPSRWYSRGWTLQELLAPTDVDFYNRSWKRIGSKWLLRREISAITGIGEVDLGVLDPARSSIAQKMSWASRRQTTKIEDEAYCLLGVLGVHLPLLYGEGANAFRRLQEELIRTSTDQTIFAWSSPLPSGRCGILASSPRDFELSGSMVSHSCPIGGHSEKAATEPEVFSKPYAMTNAGLAIELPMKRIPKPGVNNPKPIPYMTNWTWVFIALLNCRDASRSDGWAVGILLTSHKDGGTPEPPMRRVGYDQHCYVETQSGGDMVLNYGYELVERELSSHQNFEAQAVVISPYAMVRPSRRGQPLWLPEGHYHARVLVASDLGPVRSIHAWTDDSEGSQLPSPRKPSNLEATEDGWYCLKLTDSKTIAELVLSFDDTRIISILFQRQWLTGGWRSTKCGIRICTIMPSSGRKLWPGNRFMWAGYFTNFRTPQSKDGLWFNVERPGDPSIAVSAFNIPNDGRDKCCRAIEFLYFELKR
ncbi:hypothetical protein OQA88_2121 [Cercophora sp. LCS_1]